MKKVILALCLASVSSKAWAESLTCTLNPYVTSRAGLTEYGQSVTMRAEVTKKMDVDKSKCATSEGLGMKVSLCVQESDVTGGYDVVVDVVPANKSQNLETLYFATFASSWKNSILKVIRGQSQILSSVKAQLFNGNIEIPGELDGESRVINAGIAKGVSKGIIRAGELAMVTVEGCKLSR